MSIFSKILAPTFIAKIDDAVATLAGRRKSRQPFEATALACSARRLRRAYPDAAFSLTAMPEGVANSYNKGYAPPQGIWMTLVYEPGSGYSADVHSNYVPRSPYGTQGGRIRLDSASDADGTNITSDVRKRLGF